VGLYVPGDVESFTIADTGELFEHEDPFERGVVRYFDVLTDPPERGRPLVASTVTLEQMVDRILDEHRGSSSTRMTYASAEED
jgi:hypothetical protein